MNRPIPEVRTDLLALADQIEANPVPRHLIVIHLRRLANQLYRESPVRRVPPCSTPMSPELAERIRRYATARPHLSQLAIATAHNVNQGRVSEALTRKR